MAFLRVSPRLSAAFGASLAGAALLMAGGQAHAANLFTNGSFEDTTHFTGAPCCDVTEVFVGDSTTMPGWTVISNDVSWGGPSNPFAVTASPGGGDYFLDLTGFHNGAPNGGVQQAIATVAGATYTLTFDLGSSPQYGIQDGVEVNAGGAIVDFLSTNNGAQFNLWETETMTFTATGNSTLVSFTGNVGTDYVGLDNISVEAVAGVGGVPEPATWALMLLGFGGLGATLRLRRRVVAA